jgi:hypothetical protein
MYVQRNMFKGSNCGESGIMPPTDNAGDRDFRILTSRAAIAAV